MERRSRLSHIVFLCDPSATESAGIGNLKEWWVGMDGNSFFFLSPVDKTLEVIPPELQNVTSVPGKLNELSLEVGSLTKNVFTLN